MTSHWHDSVKALFAENPGLAVELASMLNGNPLPATIIVTKPRSTT